MSAKNLYTCREIRQFDDRGLIIQATNDRTSLPVTLHITGLTPEVVSLWPGPSLETVAAEYKEAARNHDISGTIGSAAAERHALDRLTAVAKR